MHVLSGSLSLSSSFSRVLSLSLSLFHSLSLSLSLSLTHTPTHSHTHTHRFWQKHSVRPRSIRPPNPRRLRAPPHDPRTLHDPIILVYGAYLVIYVSGSATLRHLLVLCPSPWPTSSLSSEFTMYLLGDIRIYHPPHDPTTSRTALCRGTSLIRNSPPPRATIWH